MTPQQSLISESGFSSFCPSFYSGVLQHNHVLQTGTDTQTSCAVREEGPDPASFSSTNRVLPLKCRKSHLALSINSTHSLRVQFISSYEAPREALTHTEPVHGTVPVTSEFGYNWVSKRWEALLPPYIANASRIITPGVRGGADEPGCCGNFSAAWPNLSLFVTIPCLLFRVTSSLREYQPAALRQLARVRNNEVWRGVLGTALASFDFPQEPHSGSEFVSLTFHIRHPSAKHQAYTNTHTEHVMPACRLGDGRGSVWASKDFEGEHENPSLMECHPVIKELPLLNHCKGLSLLLQGLILSSHWV